MANNQEINIEVNVKLSLWDAIKLRISGIPKPNICKEEYKNGRR